MALHDQITQCVREYFLVKDDAPDIDGLINLRRLLSSLKFGFAVEVGGMYKRKNATEHARKAEFYRLRQELVNGGHSAAKADCEAYAAIIALMDAEQLADSEYRAAALILDAAAGVLDTMNQHIANLRSEKKAETFGQGAG